MSAREIQVWVGAGALVVGFVATMAWGPLPAPSREPERECHVEIIVRDECSDGGAQ